LPRRHICAAADCAPVKAWKRNDYFDASAELAARPVHSSRMASKFRTHRSRWAGTSGRRLPVIVAGSFLTVLAVGTGLGQRDGVEAATSPEVLERIADRNREAAAQAALNMKRDSELAAQAVDARIEQAEAARDSSVSAR
jgi:hypothetical protein